MNKRKSGINAASGTNKKALKSSGQAHSPNQSGKMPGSVKPPNDTWKKAAQKESRPVNGMGYTAHEGTHGSVAAGTDVHPGTAAPRRPGKPGAAFGTAGRHGGTETRGGQRHSNAAHIAANTRRLPKGAKSRKAADLPGNARPGNVNAHYSNGGSSGSQSRIPDKSHSFTENGKRDKDAAVASKAQAREAESKHHAPQSHVTETQINSNGKALSGFQGSGRPYDARHAWPPVTQDGVKAGDIRSKGSAPYKKGGKSQTGATRFWSYRHCSSSFSA